MITFDKLTLKGYNGEELVNTFIRQGRPAHSLAVIFPGLNYSVDLPLLFFPRQMLVNAGADVLLVETNYGRNPAYAAADAAGRAARVEADARAALDTVLGQGHYAQITLAGKSIGTRALGWLAGDPRLAGARFLWLTPLLTDPQLVEQIRRGGQKGLFVIGTADSFYNPEILAGLVRNTGGQSVVVAEADHGMQVGNDFWASFRALQTILEAVETFLTSTPTE